MHNEIKAESSYIQNNKFKTLILGRIMLISVVFVLFFALLHTFGLNDIGDLQALTNYIHAAFVLPGYFLFKQKRISLNFCSHFFLFFCFLTSINALLTAEYDSFRAIWFFLSTMISFIFVGKKYGKLYGYGSLVFIFFAGFFLDTNLNTQSVLSSLIALWVLILVMSAYTGQMERHLNKIDTIQQELYYLANKSAISNSLTSDQKTLEVEQLLRKAQNLQESFSLVYVDVEEIKNSGVHITTSFWNDVRAQVTQKLKNLTSSSDIISQVNEHLFYIALPYKDAITVKNLSSKIMTSLNKHNIQVNGKAIELKVCISATSLRPDDTSLRTLHIRADQGLTKAKAMGCEQVVFVGI